MPKFKDLKIGAIFQIKDGTITEESTWFAWVKINNSECVLLAPASPACSIPPDFICASQDLQLDSTQYKVVNGD